MRRALSLVFLLSGCFTYTSAGDDAGGEVDAGPCAAQCMGTLPRCDPMTGQCVACLPENDNCPAGKRCRQQTDKTWACGQECTKTTECPVGPSIICCKGACIDTDLDPLNCGTCGQACPSVVHGATSCQAGKCVTTCSGGYADCDADMRNGCETDLTTDVKNCAACGRACVVPHSTATCSSSKCVVAACDFGYGDCDFMAANGCEADLQGDLANCGMCALACPAYANASGTCSFGMCRLGTCAGGFADCNVNPNDGCETNIGSDPLNCGQCGTSCNVFNAMGTCKAQMCTFTCNAGFADCDKIPQNGCEVDILGDTKNCAGCGKVCLPAANAVAQCVMGACGFASCIIDFADCDNNKVNGCETPVDADPQNCGGCGKACATPPHATAACGAGQCGIGMCVGLFGDCDGDQMNGCEKSVGADVANCGNCNNICMVPKNGTPSCANGQCGLASCSMGFANCDNDPMNGCEIDTTGDKDHCGNCNTVCQNPTPGCYQSMCIGCPGCDDDVVMFLLTSP